MDNRKKDVIRLDVGGRKWLTTERFAAVREHEIVPRLGEAQFVHNRRHRKTAIVKTNDGKFFIKMYLVRRSRLRQAVEFMTHRTRARDEWFNHLAAWEAGVPAPEPVAFSEQLPLDLRYTAIVVMRAMNPDLVSLRQWVTTPPGNEARRTRQAYREATAALASMHDHGLYHMDFTDVNVWGEAVNDGWVLRMIIDFEKYRSGSPDNDSLAFASLARASKKLKGFSNARAIRLLGYYLKDRGIFDDKKRLARYSEWLRNAAADTNPEVYTERSDARRRRRTGGAA